MRLPIVATLAGAVFLAACQQPAEFDPNDPETIAAIEAVLSEAMEGARNVDADRVLAVAEGEGELTFITGDVMLGGVEYIRETFRETYDGLERQDQTVLASQVRVLSPDVAIVIAVSEGTYTDKAGWTSDPVGMGHTLVLVRESGEWKIRHAHQSIAP
jgi:uncharacterized protein (TIGR02246 family)